MPTCPHPAALPSACLPANWLLCPGWAKLAAVFWLLKLADQLGLPCCQPCCADTALVVGGQHYADWLSSTLWLYNATEDSWARVGQAPLYSRGHVCGLHDGRLFMTLGQQGRGAHEGWLVCGYLHILAPSHSILMLLAARFQAGLAG